MSDFESGSTATFPAPQAGGRMVAGDFDGDGDADLLYQTGGNGTAFQYARSNGDGTFTILALADSPFAGLTLPDNIGVSHYAGDFDGDGDIDLFAAVAGATGSYFRNNGNGTFASASSATFPAPLAVTRVVTGDFDSDGDADILYQTGGNGTAFQYARSNGDGTFTILSQADSPFSGVSLLDHNGSNYLAGDFDGDGDVDLIGTPNGSQGEFYRNDGSTFAEGSTATFPQPGAGGRMTAGDFDADGDTDILFQTGANGTPFQYAGSNGDGTFSIYSLDASPFAGLTLPNDSGSNYFAADFDGDGDTDLLANGAAVGTSPDSYFYQVGKPPELVSSTPGDNATGVAAGANITVTFDEAVSKGSGDIHIVRASDNLVIETISVGSAQVTGAGTTWTIDPSVTLSGLTVYAIRFDAGTFKDTGGAIFAGIDDNTTLNFTTAVVNTPPAQAANAGLTLNEGTSGTISAARLDFNDTQQVDTAITYTVTTAVTNGTLRLNGAALGLGGTFTQDDINSGRVSYLHDGGETTSAVFGFSVSDGAGGSVTGQSFAFTITPVNDSPVHSLPATVFTAEEIEVPLNNGVAIDPTPTWIDDVDSGTITTTLSAVDGSFAATAMGAAIVTGAGTGSMTVTGSVADVNRTVYFASYTPASNVHGSRTLNVATSDGAGGIASDTITVSITGTNDVPEGSDVTYAATEDTAYVLSAADFGFSDPDGHSLATILLTTLPLNGRLHDIGGYGIDITGDGNPDFDAQPRDLLAGELIDLALLAGGYIRYIPAANASGADSFTFQVIDDSGGPLGPRTDPTPNTMTFDVAAVDDPAVAVNDSVATAENAVGTGSLFGNDSDVDGPALTVSEVNGDSANVGTQITLASGALLTVNADGTYAYDPNGAFAYLIDGLTAAATAALNTSALDSFTYTLANGTTATVTVTVDGLASAGDELWGSAIDNTVTGTAGIDYFDLSQGGEDTVIGDASNDAFYFGAAFTDGDMVDGGDGGNDQIGLDGDYSGANALVLAPTTITNVEAIVVLPGFDYSLTTHDDNVPDGGTLNVFAGNLGPGDNFTFNGSAETDGSFKVFGGKGTDLITTGAGDDGIYFGPGKFDPTVDRVDGGTGTSDQLALDGDYVGLTLDSTAIQNIETIVLLKGVPGDLAQYMLTVDASLVSAGQTLTIWGTQVETAMTISANTVSNGHLRMFGGRVADALAGGGSGDWFWGGLGADTMIGGAGGDTFFYQDAAESSVAGFDRLVGFDDTADKIDLDGHTVTGFAGPLSGALDLATIGAQLEAGATTLGVDQALVFSVDGGGLDGRTFLLVDGNDTAGYQASGDFLIMLDGPIGTVDNLGMFI